MSTVVTITVRLPGRSRRDALRRAGQNLIAAAWEDYPDRIRQCRDDGELGTANSLTARANLMASLGEQLHGLSEEKT